MDSTFSKLSQKDNTTDQSTLFDFQTTSVTQKIIPVEPDKPVIEIFVSAEWTLRPADYGKKDANGRVYTDKYRGGWTITKCVGHPEINGGFCTPDMMALYPTEKSIIDRFMNYYSDWLDGMYRIKIKLKVTQDDRNPKMENF